MFGVLCDYWVIVAALQHWHLPDTDICIMNFVCFMFKRTTLQGVLVNWF